MKEYLECPTFLRKLLQDLELARLVLARSFADEDSWSPKHAEALKSLTTGAKQLSSELRAWGGKTKSELDKMTPAMKTRVMIQFIQGLPISNRRDTYRVLAGLEKERPDGLTLAVKDRFEEEP